MNELFENEYLMDKKLLKEYVYNVLCKKTIIISLITALSGILFFWFVSNRDAYIVLTVAIIASISAILLPIIAVKELEETGKRLNNGNIEKTNIKFSNNIVMNEGKAHLEFEYTQITKIIQTKNFIVLKTSENTAILVLKKGFLKGNEKDFIKFVEEKTNK